MAYQLPRISQHEVDYLEQKLGELLLSENLSANSTAAKAKAEKLREELNGVVTPQLVLRLVQEIKRK